MGTTTSHRLKHICGVGSKKEQYPVGRFFPSRAIFYDASNFWENILYASSLRGSNFGFTLRVRLLHAYRAIHLFNDTIFCASTQLRTDIVLFNDKRKEIIDNFLDKFHIKHSDANEVPYIVDLIAGRLLDWWMKITCWNNEFCLNPE